MDLRTSWCSIMVDAGGGVIYRNIGQNLTVLLAKLSFDSQKAPTML